jgi:hypothetical protein
MEKFVPIVHEELSTFKSKFESDKDCMLQVSFIHSGGKASRTARSATAFGWREAMFHTYIQIGWDGKWLEGEMRYFAQTFKERLRPFSLEGRATFFNFPDGPLKPDYHEQAYWGDNHEKLQQVKQIWDKDNYFDSVQGVRLPHASATVAAPSVDMNVQELTDGIAILQWDHHNRLPVYSLYSAYIDALRESFGVSFVDRKPVGLQVL